jgi:alpha-tubulin suppressor-like RCC1 family protein
MKVVRERGKSTRTFPIVPTVVLSLACAAALLIAVPPAAIAAPTAVVSIGAGSSHACAVTADGIAKCWGDNFLGDLGDGSGMQQDSPVDVQGLIALATSIGAGTNHSCAVVGGGVKCWGENNNGQLGQGFYNTHSPTPVDVVTLTSGVEEVAVGAAHSCALTTGGGLKCWGSSGSGQLGGGFPIGSGVGATPVDVVGLSSGVQDVSAGGGHTCAVTAGGGAKCWGTSGSGQVGDGGSTNTSPRATPVDVVGLTSGVQGIEAGSAHSCALTTGGGVQCWGNQSFGQLGNGVVSFSAVQHAPVQVTGLTSGVVGIGGGERHTCAITSLGGLKCWGQNNAGQLGDGTTTDRSTPVDVVGLAGDVVAVDGGHSYTCALLDTGAVQCWGRGDQGQLGDGLATNSLAPVDVDFGTSGTTFTLDMTIVGQGTVTSDPVGIDCGSTCSFDYDDGTVVTLSALPDLGSTFDGWSGAGCSGADDCTLTMSQARSVTASFSSLPPMTTRLSDDFDGSALDGSKWNTSIATGGVRWCASTQANHLTTSGLWQDVSTQACHGVFASPPHGSISVNAGSASFSAATRRTFPYVWRGGPTGTSPFPDTGDFVLEVRLRFDSLAPNGTEFHVGDWPNTDPVGDNPPGHLGFAIGACGACGLVTNLLGATDTVAGPTAFHDYRLEYVNGRYSLWVDGVRTMGPVASSIRPNAIWMGNPVFTHWTFSDWTDFTIDSVQISAEQAVTYPLDVTKDGSGGGSVSSSPTGIDCGPTCSASFDDGTQVTLTATPNGTSSFTGWSGEGCTGTGTCDVTMNQGRSVTATFTKNTYTLNVTKAGSGEGTISSSPTGIDCGSTCSAIFSDGTQVTLSALPVSGSTFQEWSGDCGGTGSCTLSMSETRDVTARFTSLPQNPVWGWGQNLHQEVAPTFCPPIGDCFTPLQVAGPSEVVAVAGGSQHSLALSSDGTVWGWGDNQSGPLGSACPPTACSPTRIAGLTNVVAISASVDMAVSLALRSDGSVWGLGYGGYGMLGDVCRSNPCFSPVRVDGLSDIVAIAAGGEHALALRSDGTVWAWGWNVYGQLGNSTCASVCATPMQVTGLTNVEAIAAGSSHSLALLSDGTVWAWGRADSGRLGNSTCLAVCPTPVQVSGLTDVAAISAGGRHSLALRSDGVVWGWGHNQTFQAGSQCGLGSLPRYCSTPHEVNGLTNVVAISAGGEHSLALRSDGTVWGWGWNVSGQLANTTCQTCVFPTRVNGVSEADAISAGMYHSLAVANASSPVGESVSVDVGLGDPPVTTDVEGDGATPSDPVETAVTSPNEGTVTIQDGPSDVTNPPGFSFFGEQMTIEAPDASPDEPLTLEFRLDASAIPAEQSAQTLAVFRNGAYVLACAGSSGHAEPDPCVSLRETLPDGDARITVLTSHASDWNLGFAIPVSNAGGPYTVPEGSTVRLNASGSVGTDPLLYQWLPDTALDNGALARPIYTARDDGSEQLTLTVTDATGMSGTATATVTVTNAVPVVHVTGPATVTSGQTVALSASFTDAGTIDTHTESVNWGDGTITSGVVSEANGSGTVAGSHRYLVPGSYAITVKVTDDDGGLGQATSASFPVTRAPVGLDVKPGDSSNTIQLSTKQVAVAILSTATFDATTKVVRSSLTFGRTGAEASLLLSKGVPSCSTPDVNSDGRKDLSCNFTTTLTALRKTDTLAVLRGRTSDGVFLEGHDAVRVK